MERETGEDDMLKQFAQARSKGDGTEIVDVNGLIGFRDKNYFCVLPLRWYLPLFSALIGVIGKKRNRTVI